MIVWIHRVRFDASNHPLAAQAYPSMVAKRLMAGEPQPFEIDGTIEAFVLHAELTPEPGRPGLLSLILEAETRDGETLQQIAERFCGKPMAWM